MINFSKIKVSGESSKNIVPGNRMVSIDNISHKPYGNNLLVSFFIREERPEGFVGFKIPGGNDTYNDAVAYLAISRFFINTTKERDLYDLYIKLKLIATALDKDISVYDDKFESVTQLLTALQNDQFFKSDKKIALQIAGTREKNDKGYYIYNLFLPPFNAQTPCITKDVSLLPNFTRDLIIDKNKEQHNKQDTASFNKSNIDASTDDLSF